MPTMAVSIEKRKPILNIDKYIAKFAYLYHDVGTVQRSRVHLVGRYTIPVYLLSLFHTLYTYRTVQYYHDSYSERGELKGKSPPPDPRASQGL